MKLKEIIKATNGRLVQGNKDSIVSNISIDTRTIKPNDLFMAIKGKYLDGHSFIREALQKGASTIIAEDIRFEYETWKTVNIVQVVNTTKALEDIAQYYRKQFKPIVIAVTGSNGKTTTKEMITHILKEKYKVISAPASYNNNIGVPLTILNLTDDVEMLILEMEMNELGGTKRLCEIAQPDIGVITNIGDTHLEFLFSRDNVAREKSELLEYVSKQGTAILNADDAKVMEIWTWFNVKKCLTFGIKQSADVYAKNIINHGEHG
ncbi:MAG: UDP-N-acetylmuramoyl-tripeptide--D-alanyl-D-alanine ligase, partial [candidate division WOR-3 bacterium]